MNDHVKLALVFVAALFFAVWVTNASRFAVNGFPKGPGFAVGVRASSPMTCTDERGRDCRP